MTRFLAIVITILALSFKVSNTYAQVNPLHLTATAQAAGFTLAANGKAASIITDTADATVAGIAATALSADIKLVTGATPLIGHNMTAGSYPILIGTLGRSKWIDALAAKGALPVAKLRGKWETFCLLLVDHPTPQVKRALVIVGSDPRGTAFGVFELSKLIGVSPLVWWADVMPTPRSALYLAGAPRIAEPPSVKYRGIFINDEDWGLQPWAATTFEPETGDIGPKTYATVFELLLRLKANLIWPAMHPSTKPFFHYPGNKQVAADYAILIGSSHAEPMLRNNVGEWDSKTMGDFNYGTNQQRVYQYWEDRVKESSKNEAVYSLGMRGIHDSGMEGIKDPKDAVPLLERIFGDQRALLSKYINKNVTQVPQAFTAYKEVLDIYDHQLKVPDDVILVWPDDNYGYIQRLNDEKEKQRVGGSGVYYHASYWGRPHDYLWLGTTHPGLMREEMMKAYNSQADQLWVLNVGDIKPLEYSIQCFLDMAWQAAPFQNSSYSRQHLRDWCTTIFGKEKGPAVQELLWQYYQLAFERRPEFMGWSQTEPTTKTAYTAYNHFFYGDEARQRIDRYDSLEQAVKRLRTGMNAKDSNAFYELVYYPVVSASLMNKKFLYRDKNYCYSRQNRLSAYDYAKRSEQAYNDIVKETVYYNSELAGGKWKNILSMKPRELPVYQSPVIAPFTIDSTTTWNVIPEGDSTGTLAALPSFDPLNRQRYFMDVFLTGAATVDWTATTTDKRIALSATRGRLKVDNNQQRIWVEVDWSKDARNKPLSAQITIDGGGKQRVVQVTGAYLSTGLPNYKGFIESNGVVSIYAANYSRNTSRQTAPWKILDGLGYTGRSLQNLSFTTRKPDTTEAAVKRASSYVAYDFYTFSSAAPAVLVFSLPTHPVNKDYSMRYAISIDDGPVKTVDCRTYGRSEVWKQNVLRNNAVQRIPMPFLNKGKHTLKVYSIDPGVTLDRIVIDLGGFKNAYGVVAETKQR